MDEGNNIIVVNGFNAVPEVTKAAKANPDVWFIGVDHDICIDAEGVPDADFAGPNRAVPASGVLTGPRLPNYIGLNYQEDQVGYLAGIVACEGDQEQRRRRHRRHHTVWSLRPLHAGLRLGAKSINPDIQVKIGWVTESDFTKAFYDPAGGKAYAEQFSSRTMAWMSCSRSQGRPETARSTPRVRPVSSRSASMSTNMSRTRTGRHAS